MLIKAGPSFQMFACVLELLILNIYSGACTQDMQTARLVQFFFSEALRVNPFMEVGFISYRNKYLAHVNSIETDNNGATAERNRVG